MTPRERVLRAFGRAPGRPDRMPLQFDLCLQLTEAFGRKLGVAPEYALSYYEDLTYRISANAIRTRLGSDCVVVGGTVRKGFVPERVEGDVTRNEFGMHMKPTSLYVEVVKCPLEDAASRADIEGYAFPDALAPGRFDAARRDIDRFGRDHFVIGDVELSLFELAWHLTGMEKYLMAMLMGEAWVDALDDRVEHWTTALALELVHAGVDAVWFGEDLGSQTSTLISPDQWRERYKPRHSRMIRAVKQANPEVLVIMHSDGAVAPLLDDFIEMGVDVFNPVQPNVPGSDPEELSARYGGRIHFFGGIDQQVLLPGGDREAISAELARRARILGSRSGYLMAPAHILQADVAVETVEHMIRVVQALGA
ncbi:MAG TPA: uroporphyrinogen decarboxylase family protein [Thermoanaerobaculaceae bacterium]|nr:uroporphyrinogen decarboxylase family protein [Thermoanaerobaculaceae bacterium]